MGSRADKDKTQPPSGVADALGGAAVFPARVAARAWRGQLETAVEDLLLAPEVGRVLDQALAGPLPEELARSLVRRRVVERVVEELAASGELERMVDSALASPRTQELLEHVLASEAMGQVLRRVVTGPEVRAAAAAHSAGLAEQVMHGVRHGARHLDRELSVGPAESEQTRFAGVASRGIALFGDALAVAAISVTIGAAAGLVGSLVGGIHPEWLARALLSLAGLAIAVGYFSLFWSTAGQTPGMRLMEVRVIPARSGRHMTLSRALLRTFGLALAIIPCFLGFVPAFFDRRRRALPDYLAGTVVVYGDSQVDG